jgi:hypothetical protein
MSALRRQLLRLAAVLSCGVSVVLALCAVALPDASAAMLVVASATASGGTWGSAQEIAVGLNTSASAQVSSVCCASAGNCGAGGFYSHGSNQEALSPMRREARGTPGKR